MKLINNLISLVFWRKSYRDMVETDLSCLDSINSKLQEVVLDTSCISKRIIHKLDTKSIKPPYLEAEE